MNVKIFKTIHKEESYCWRNGVATLEALRQLHVSAFPKISCNIFLGYFFVFCNGLGFIANGFCCRRRQGEGIERHSQQ